MKLHEYLCDCKREDPYFTEASFAKKLDVTTVSFSKIKRGRLKPSTELAIAISIATGGKVQPEELLGTVMTKRKNSYRSKK